MSNFLKSAFKLFFPDKEDAALAKVDAKSAVVVLPEDKVSQSVAEAELPVSLTIWTIERNRYTAARALCTDVDVYPSEAVDLIEDIKGYVLDTPNGENVVVEARTGSLVGHSLEVVRDGVRDMSKGQLNTQLDTGRKEFNRMKKVELSNDEFWQAIKMGSSETEVLQDYQE